MGLTKSIGIPMLIGIFDFFFKTVSQIHFKLGGYVPWVGPYQIFFKWSGSSDFWIFNEFFGLIFDQILKNSISL